MIWFYCLDLKKKSTIMTLTTDDKQETSAVSKNLERKIQRKQKRFQHMIGNDSGVICFDKSSPNLVICNAGLSTGLDQTTLVSELTKFGAVSNAYLLHDKSYCFVVCADEAAAVNIYNGVHGKSRLGQNDTVIYLSYCDEIPEKYFNTSSQQTLPPGLVIIENFLTSAEEEMLINLIEWSETDALENSILKHRQVKHFGYEFRYGTNDVDVDQPLIDEPIPKECDFIWSRLQNRDLNGHPHQLTVNKYEPGQGIPSHVDTHSAFRDSIISLSLASDIVMEFRKPNVHNVKECTEHISVTLPRRSLLIMSNESRYGWRHAITPRKIDVMRNADGHLTTQFRSKRISYTFRWLSTEACECEFNSLCDTFQKRISNQNEKGNRIENPSQCELENVHKVYNEIANHFSETRHSPWPQVNAFIQQFEIGSVLVDIGCGNGKYLQSNPSIFEIGCDRSDGLLNVCRDREFNVFQCDCLQVPLRSNSVDGCISIAVIHHLASEERRLKAINEMIRILRPGGQALIYVWAKNQSLQSKSNYLKSNERKNGEKTNSNDERIVTSVKSDNQQNTSVLPIHTNRTEFEHTDILVPWKLKNPTPSDKNGPSDQHPTTFLRFYHVFEENELERLCKQMPNISIVKSYYDQGNWCVIFEKTQSN